MERIPVAGPSISQKEIDYVTDAVTNSWYSRANEYHDRFEKAFAAYVGRRYALALPSCTSAIHLALLALGVGPGDEVVVPELTWIATAAPILYVGATPVFADVDPDTWCLSPDAFARVLSPRTKAVIPVGLYGSMPDFGRLSEICRARSIALIEDAAEAMGSRYDGRPAGSFGDASVFSFHGSKTMTTGEGGMLVTDRQDIFERACFLRDHGRDPRDKSFYCREVAYKYKVSALQAALGLAQVERIEELVEKKRTIFSWYKEELQHLPGIRLNAEPPRTWNSYWMTSIVLPENSGLEKETFLSSMATHRIDCRPFFYPLSSMPAFASFSRKSNDAPFASKLGRLGINLPSGLNLTREMVVRVSGAVRVVLAEAGRVSSQEAVGA